MTHQFRSYSTSRADGEHGLGVCVGTLPHLPDDEMHPTPSTRRSRKLSWASGTTVVGGFAKGCKFLRSSVTGEKECQTPSKTSSSSSPNDRYSPPPAKGRRAGKAKFFKQKRQARIDAVAGWEATAQMIEQELERPCIVAPPYPYPYPYPCAYPRPPVRRDQALDELAKILGDPSDAIQEATVRRSISMMNTDGGPGIGGDIGGGGEAGNPINNGGSDSAPNTVRELADQILLPSALSSPRRSVSIHRLSGETKFNRSSWDDEALLDLCGSGSGSGSGTGTGSGSGTGIGSASALLTGNSHAPSHPIAGLSPPRRAKSKSVSVTGKLTLREALFMRGNALAAAAAPPSSSSSSHDRPELHAVPESPDMRNRQGSVSSTNSVGVSGSGSHPFPPRLPLPSDSEGGQTGRDEHKLEHEHEHELEPQDDKFSPTPFLTPTFGGAVTDSAESSWSTLPLWSTGLSVLSGSGSRSRSRSGSGSRSGSRSRSGSGENDEDATEILREQAGSRATLHSMATTCSDRTETPTHFGSRRSPSPSPGPGPSPNPSLSPFVAQGLPPQPQSPTETC